ncbi:DNA ligase 1 isoform X2 [Cimex lectularius]|uniref:Uncharacterized protein n=1 Tax=Cimex lectularius TaxID=79782 RepID=A0A8I6RZ50_CIMLE|nr:DNA ligase 1 isoform X2 [Cimex lectularius]
MNQKEETLMQAQAELKEKRKQNRENNDQRSEEGNAGTITPKEGNASNKTDEKTNDDSEIKKVAISHDSLKSKQPTSEKTNDDSEIKKVAISHDSLKSKQPTRSNQKIEPVKSKDSSRSQNPTNDLAKGSESQSRSQNQNAESVKSNESRSGQKVEPTNDKDSDSLLGMGLEALCLGHTSSDKTQNQSNISAKGSETRLNLKKSEPRENLKKSESTRSKESSRDKRKQQVSSKSRDRSRQKRMQKNKDSINKGDKMKIQSEVGEDANKKGNELDKEKEVKQEAQEASKVNDTETDEKAPQERTDLQPPIDKKKDDAESEAAFSPQLYSFTQMSKTSGVRLAMSPPFWLLMDHLLAVTWKLYSKKESEKKGLGIAQLQWAYEFLAVMKDKNNELKQPMNSLSALLEDALINAYSKLGDINKISEQTDSQGFKNNKATRKDDTEHEEKMSVETGNKQWEPQEKQVSYTLNDILIRAPTLQKDYSKESKTKEDKQIKMPEQKKTLEKGEVLKYLEHIKKEQRDRAYREKIHLEEIEEVIKLVQKDKFENETWRKSALKKEDKSKKRMHEDLLANEKSEVHFSA